MLSFVMIKFKITFNLKDKRLLFLLIVNVIPILLMLLTSLITGAKLRTMWMTPFYLFMGVLIVYMFQSQINLKKFNHFISVFIILFIISPFAYGYISITQKNKRTDYPGNEISQLVEKRWNKNFTNKIAIVIGDEWHAGNLSYHLESRPKWFLEGIPKNFDLEGGVIYTGNVEVLKEVCPGEFGSIKRQGICMIGNK